MKTSARDNETRCFEAFRRGIVNTPLLPTHLYITVTEACNLRCGHCITHAPQKTREGSARTLSPWLIEALREAFSAARYFGFVHGGESLMSPLFGDVLRAIQLEKQNQPYCVHLLSNGMLLNGERARELCDLGLNSLCISLDGPVPEINDFIRIGGSFHQIVKHIREILLFRQSSKIDLRVGISMVISQISIDQLPAMGKLCADLGVDWLKIEEMAPVTPMAKKLWAAPPSETQDARAREAMLALMDVLKSSTVVLVDHRDPPQGCPCEAMANPELRTFRTSDDYANRTMFFPCRAAFEIACIDPDGAVHPIDYFHDSIGFLSEAPLSALWNNKKIQSLRIEALKRIPESMRISCACPAPALH